MTDRWTDRLSEYLDGELSPQTRAELEQHLEGCFECRRTLGELRAVVARARALPDAEPVHDFWPGIAGRLAAAPQADQAALEVIDLRTHRIERNQRRISFTLPQLAAASLVLMLLSGSAVWVALARAPLPVASAPATGNAVRSVADSNAGLTEYAAAVESLEAALAQQQDRLDPVTVAIVKENLRTIDAAITEARAALEQDPGNLYLNQHLENTMKKKLQLLRRATALRGASS
jgi:anti-sigma factor RsiW